MDMVAITEITKKISLMSIEVKNLKNMRTKIFSQDKQLQSSAKKIFYHNHKLYIRVELNDLGDHNVAWKAVKAVSDQRFDALPEDKRKLYIDLARIQEMDKELEMV